jgi:hypothetical protein
MYSVNFGKPGIILKFEIYTYSKFTFNTKKRKFQVPYIWNPKLNIIREKDTLLDSQVNEFILEVLGFEPVKKSRDLFVH